MHGGGTSQMLHFIPSTAGCSEAQVMPFHEMASEARLYERRSVTMEALLYDLK